MTFEIQHRVAGSAGTPPPDPRALRWRTCLREISFFEGGTRRAAGPTLRDADAYALVLEIICGLHSPIVGETQVAGQFRAFLSSLSGSDTQWLAAIGDDLIHDARLVRERHLRGVGSGSYGSAVRRRLESCRAIAVIGRGALASELRPYLEDCGRVEAWTRQELASGAIRSRTVDPSGLVVAAPVSNAAVEHVARHYTDLRRVVDLRAADERAPLPFPSVITLDTLFADARETAAVSADRVDAARRMIRDRARAFASRQQVRPFGWDDLCA